MDFSGMEGNASKISHSPGASRDPSRKQAPFSIPGLRLKAHAGNEVQRNPHRR
jgi:hypothetical protein